VNFTFQVREGFFAEMLLYRVIPGEQRRRGRRRHLSPLRPRLARALHVGV
jgi:hypothetical protein